MSSNTQIHIRPIQTTYEVSSEQVVAIDRILGEGGTRLLRDMLQNLEQIRQDLGPDSAKMLDWQPVEGHRDSYQTNLNGAHLVLELQQGLTARLTLSQYIRLPAEARPRLSPDLYKAAHHKVNYLLAVAMSQQIAQKMTKQYMRQQQQQRVSQSIRHQQTVNQTAVNNNSLRIMAYFTSRR